MAKEDIDLCDIEGCREKSIAKFEDKSFCSCEHYLVYCSRKWPSLVGETNSLAEYQKKQQKAFLLAG